MSRENRSHRRPSDPVSAAVADLERSLRTKLRESVEPVSGPFITPAERYDDWPGTRQAYPHGYPQDRRHGRNWPTIRNEDDLRQARAFSRLLADTNPLVIGFVGHVGSYVVGPGFKWSVGLKGVAGDDPAEKKDPAVQACQKFLDEFRQINGWGDVGEIGVGDLDDESDDSPPTNLEMEGWESAMEDGELFLRLFNGGANTNGVPTVRKVNPECVYCPPGQTQEGPWSFGIETDPEDRQRRLAYHVADPDGHPQDGEVVPAGRIVHLKLNAKTDVKRGVPDFWVLEEEATHLRKLWRNMGEVGAILSAIAYIRQHAPGVTGTQIASMNDRLKSGTDSGSAKWGDRNAEDIYRTYTRMEAGTQIDVTNGQQWVPPPLQAGIPNFVQGMQAVLRIFGLRWGCPEYFSGDSSNANFASTLVSGGPFERATIKRQQQYKRFQGNLATRALLFGVKAGRLTKEQVMRVSVSVTPPAVAIANKTEDTSRRVQLMQAAGLSKRTVLEEEGYDPDREAANAKKEAAEGQPPQQPGGDPGAPVPQGGPSPDAGGGEVDLSGLAEQLFAEGLVREDRAGLVKKTVITKTGKKQTVYVNPNKDAPADPKAAGRQDAGGTTVGGEAVPDEVAAKVRDPGRLEKFGLRLASILFRAGDLMEKVGMPAIESVFDTPSDLSKFGYAPTAMVDGGRGMAGMDPIREHLGVSAHLAASLIGRAASAVYGAIRRKRQGQPMTEAVEGLDELVGLWREILAAGHELLGLPEDTVPGDEQIRAGLEALAAKGAGDVAESRIDSVLLSESFTGMRTGRDGRKRCYRDGKPVPCQDLKAAATPAPTAPVAPKKAVKKTPIPAAKRTPAPKLSEKAARAKSAHVLVDKTVQRYAEEHVEPRFAAAVGGLSFPDSEPVDVVIGEAGRLTDGVELKTMVLGKDEKLTMNAYAQVRKKVWQQAQGVPFHTVAIDDREVFSPDGDHDESKRKYYYRRGIAGSARVGGMHLVEGGIDELKRLMATPEEELPDAAKVKEGEWLTKGRWVPLKTGRGYHNPVTKQTVLPKK